MMEEDTEPARAEYMIGQDLSTLSVEDLNRAIALLKSEIVRLEQALGAKDQTRAAAENFFKRS